ncbi:MAG: hypothetical protein RIE31_05140 [Alphaproteobacteria bacterium]
MTVSIETTRWEYAGDGTTTVFPYTNRIFAEGDLRVYADGTLQSLNASYSITGAGSASGGNVVFMVAPADGVTIVMVRNVPQTQETDYVENDTFPAESHETALDKLTVLVQQLQDELDRAMKVPESEVLLDMTLPALTVRASQYLGFDSNSQPVSYAAPAGTTSLSTFGALLAVTADADAARSILKSPEPLNAVVDGDFDWWLDGTSFTGVGDHQKCGLWTARKNGTWVADFKQSSDVPTATEAGFLLNHSLHVDVTTGQPSFGATNLAAAVYAIEGYRWAALLGASITVEFWVKATKTGTYSVSIFNASPNQAVSGSYTINAAGTWERKIVTFPQPPVVAWATDHNKGAELWFALAMGTAYQAAPGVWAGGTVLAAAGQANGVDDAANDFRIAGLRMHPGTAVMSMRRQNPSQALRDWQRYFAKSFSPGTVPAQGTTSSGAHLWHITRGGGGGVVGDTIRLPVSMRTTPTVTFFNTTNANANPHNYDTAVDMTSPSAQNSSESLFRLQAIPDAGAVVGHLVGIHWTADARM